MSKQRDNNDFELNMPRKERANNYGSRIPFEVRTQASDLDYQSAQHSQQYHAEEYTEQPRQQRTQRRQEPERDLDSDVDDEEVINKPKVRRQRRERASDAGSTPFFKDKRLRIFLGVLLPVIGAAMAIILISHIKNGGADQSVTINSTIEQAANSGEPIGNAGNAFGAWLADVLFTNALGLGSLVISVYLWIVGINLLRNKKRRFWSLTFVTLLTAISASIILGALTYGLDSEINWGGNHGHYVTEYLMNIAGPLGPIVLCLILAAALVCVYLNDLSRFYGHYKKFRDARREKKARARAQMEKEEALRGQAERESYMSTQGGQRQAAKHVEVSADVTEDTEDTVIIDEKVNQPVSKTEHVGFNIDEPTESTKSTNVTNPTDDGSKDDSSDVPMTIRESAPEDDATDEFGDSEQPSELFDHRAELSRYHFPSLDILADHPFDSSVNMEELRRNKERIVKAFSDYKITISSITATVGPTVTLYEIVPTEGTRISKITVLENDIAMSLAASGIRIIAPMPRRGTIGIEVPNAEPRTVWMRRMLESPKFKNSKAALPVALGATIENEVFVADLAKMPHLLVAGATGQGKSVGLNVIITSLLYKKHPTELKFVLIDPKMVEFSLYEKLNKHYMAQLQDEEEAVITSPETALNTLNSLCVEMDKRLALFKQAQAKNIEEYNEKFTKRALNPENGHRFMPYIVVIIDEFYDLMMVGGKDIEAPVIRITQKARAAGIHMIIATQRPSTNVLTGVIKANCPARIAFKVMQMVDSRTIIDRPGANKLIGRGDMLYTTGGDPERIQCAFITTEEIEAVVDAVNNQVGLEPYYLPEPLTSADGGGASGNIAGGTIGKDQLFDEAARFIVTQSSASTSSLQRRYQIGYNRAGKIMDQLEAAGIVGAASGSKPRSVLVDSVALESILSGGI
jgi:S-DNA-T family DNA segregation ATPase FtsK/SpoIIIE